MRHLVIGVIGIMLISVVAREGFAADGTPAPAVGAAHPIVGSWRVEWLWPGDAAPEIALITFSADGTVIATEGGFTWHGAWIATGPRSVDFSYVTLGSEQIMPDGARFFGGAEVEADGDTLIRSSQIKGGGLKVHGERITAR